MRRIVYRATCLLVAGAMTVGLSSCNFGRNDSTHNQTQIAETKPYVDPSVGDVLRAFYQDQLPSLALKSGVKDQDNNEIRCDFSMLQKTAFVDFDADGETEIVLLYDVSEKTGEKNSDVAVLLDLKDGEPTVVNSHSGSYGASTDGDGFILTYYNSRVCRVRFINKPGYEAILIDQFTGTKWKTAVSAYKHVYDHDGVKLENNSCYIDHSGNGLYKAGVGNITYSKEKFLNFRTPNETFDGLVTSLLAETLLP